MAGNETKDPNSLLVRDGSDVNQEETENAMNESALKSVGFKLEDGDDDDDNNDEIDGDIDDALDEGYMGMECTLERGFSLNESAIAKDLRHEKYDSVAIKYVQDPSLKRYKPSVKHFIPVRKASRSKDEIPVDEAGLWSFLTVSWITNMMWKAYRKGLKEDDVPLCSKYDMCEYNTDRLELYWNAELKKGKDAASLQYALWRFYKTRFLFGIFIFSITIILGFIGPIVFMRFFISWLSSDEPLVTGVCWVTGLIVSELARVTLFCLIWSVNYRNGIRLRAACLGMLYRKLMKMSSLGNKSVGEVINLFANDSQRIFDFVVVGPFVIGGPMVAVGGVVYILWLLGPWALFGMVTFLLFYPFQYGISRLTGYLRRKTVAVTDRRVRMMNELLQSVKLIKMYAWEKSFAATVSGIRKCERELLERSAYVQSLTVAMAPTVPIIAAIVTFLAHIGAGYNLTPAQGMTVIAYFLGQVRSSLNMLKFSVSCIVEGNESVTRVKRMLLMEELSPYIGRPQDSSLAVVFKDATLAWNSVTLQAENTANSHSSDKEPSHTHPQSQKLLPSPEPQYDEVLFGLNFTVRKGELIGVCGGVGAGKSSVISGVLGHMRLTSGQVSVDGSIAYVGQQAWILNATVRDNILLDEVFDAKRYYRVIHACSLTQDIEAMPAGDMTEIGERGINLSGGQKQRISLARAVYTDRDIYLLDDPLSAVDAHVGSHLFQWVIKKALQGKTTIFVTHQLQYLPQCDRVLHIHDGRVVGFDSHTKLFEDNLEYAALYKSHMDNIEKEECERDEFSPPVVRRRLDSTMSTGSERNSIPDKGIMDDIQEGFIHAGGKVIGQLLSEEKVDSGDIPWSTYHSYIMAAGGYIVSVLVVMTFLINVGSTAFSSWWLSVWLSAGSGNTSVVVGNDTVLSDNIADNPDRHYYQTVYGSLIVLILATSLFRGFTFMKTTLKASSRMHDEVFLKVFRSPMSFFDTTPSGRIINIFSRDMDEVDVRVPITLESLIQNAFLIASALLFVCLVFPYILPILAVLGVTLVFIRNIFRVGIRDLKRLENVSRSPLYSHISTTINGLAAINAYGKQSLFTKKFSVYFDENTCVFYLFNCGMRWLAVRLDLLALSVASSTALLALFLRGTVDASFAGLALAYAIQLSGIFQYTVRLSTETEARFTSVQRLNDCTKVLSCEAPSIIESNRPDPLWPKYGHISFRKVQMKYRPDTPLVLKGISFHIDSMEKIGVVGRTGSGKSSLATVLFRLVELTAGSIRIDGIDISTIGLEDLRSKLSIIPQDPVLFIGTVRYNLDPFESHSDEDIWLALEQTYMKDRITSLDQGLSSPVVENGDNFSVGERQLLCMTRVLLRNSKILFLDEATAAIDTETDNKIQQTLKNAFKDCTMITVAHRLNTVLSCSRVIVLDDGKVAEFDTPRALLSNQSSMFAKMVAKSKATFLS